MNILIAEDNLLLHKLHGEFMNNWGYHFDIASNGLEAVKLAQENEGKYDLCLMNVEMPKMDGIEATKIIRRTVKFFPIIAYSSNGNYRKACYEAGMNNPGFTNRIYRAAYRVCFISWRVVGYLHPTALHFCLSKKLRRFDLQSRCNTADIKK